MRFTVRNGFLILLAAIFVSALAGCSPDDPPTPTQPQITPPPTGTKAIGLSAYPGQIPADGISSTLIIATCTVGGQQAPNNLPVRFSSDAGDFSLNGIDPINDQEATRSYETYTAGGQASIYLLSEENPATVTVLGRFGNEASATVKVKFVRKDQDIGDIVIKLTPDSGAAPLTISAEATVLSKSAQPLSDVKVEFSCSDPSAKIDNKKVKTDADGIASTFIRDISRDATIEAAAGTMKSKDLVEITNEEDKSIKLVALSNTGTALSEPVLINSSASLLLRATVTSASSGGVAIPNVMVNFSITDSGAYFSQSQVKTNSNGEAETFVHNINGDATITARTQNTNDTLTVRTNQPPVAVINLVSGSPSTTQVSVLVFSAANSFDPDLPFGDTINYSWSFSINSTGATVPLAQSASADGKVVTLTVGNAVGPVLPAAGDVLTVVLTVQDSNGLSSTDVMTITF